MVAKNPRSGAKKFYSQMRKFALQTRAGYFSPNARVK